MSKKISVIFIRLTGKLPSRAAMLSFLNDSYVADDDDMEYWRESQIRSPIQFTPDYIDLYK